MTGLFKHWKTRRYATEDRAKNVEDFNGAQGKIASKDTLDKIKLRGAYTLSPVQHCGSPLWKHFSRCFQKSKLTLVFFTVLKQMSPLLEALNIYN